MNAMIKSFFVTSRYIATVNSEVHKRHLVAIGQGTVIDGVQCTPEYVELLPRQPDISRARLRIVVSIALYCSYILQPWKV